MTTMEKVSVAYNLKVAESSLDLSTEAINTANQEEYIKKQEKFKRTVMGAYDICSKKLYKATDPTLEDYFRRKWKISRAQVYRFLDAAAVLKQLDEFKYQPSHERLCRTLKQHAKIPKHMKMLWSKVLESAGDRLTSINSALVASVWNDMIKQGIISMKEVEEAAAGKKKRKGNKKQSSNKMQKVSKDEKKKINTESESEGSLKEIKLEIQKKNETSSYITNANIPIPTSNIKYKDINNNTKVSQGNEFNTKKASPSMSLKNTVDIVPSANNTQPSVPTTVTNTIVTLPQNTIQCIPRNNTVITSPTVVNSNSSIVNAPTYNTTVQPQPLTPQSQSPMIQEVTKHGSVVSQSPNPTYSIQQGTFTTVDQRPIQMFPSYANDSPMSNTTPQRITQTSQIQTVSKNYNTSMTISSPTLYNENYNTSAQSNTITASSNAITQVVQTENQAPNISMPIQYSSIVLQTTQPIQQITPIHSSSVMNNNTFTKNNNMGPIQTVTPTPSPTETQAQAQPQLNAKATTLQENVVNVYANPQQQTYYPNQNNMFTQQTTQTQGPQQPLSNTYQVYSTPAHGSNQNQHQQIIYNPQPQPTNIITQQSSQNPQVIYTTSTPNNQNQNQVQNQQTNIIYTTSTNIQGGTTTYVNHPQAQQNPIYNVNPSNNPSTTYQGQNQEQPSYIYSNNMSSIGMKNQNSTSYMMTTPQNMTYNINGNQSNISASGNMQAHMIPSTNPNPQNYYNAKSTYFSINNLTSQHMKEERTNLNYILNK
ncbi:hypothetical protein H8356DRAFT_1026571 [Neocallimastix lanati (nom. inval.)]|uniref:Uncharacterized protein n=1 Tax=Neocallimastix californiae TaxID=1754190 RepID=A0A1Y2FPA0_9FUNG|nr:hypothetical protein H8356DRAFT_1026571 [Neocallimastix sp. JGI-2020a]ORY85811.1 hypothetical protein LY90DRAFT_663297 [Neocallimastix californiae]|eukprot:ORY85811.1 hypothetical protein LY90DRAFT_663297 [Neocallimastix californiae]